MMAMLWAQQIMLGKKTYSQVPRLLKDKVKEILIDSGTEELVTEEQQYGHITSSNKKAYPIVGASGDYRYEYKGTIGQALSKIEAISNNQEE